ncbi:MAG: CARDB domain-containing protein [Thermoproteota archaeon]
MNGAPVRPEVYIMTSLIVVFLMFSAALSVAEPPEQAVGVPRYRSIVLDGDISALEYPLNQLSEDWGKLYAAHDGSRMAIGIVLGNNYRSVDVLFNTGDLSSTVLNINTVRYSVNRSGVLKYYYGSVNRWVEVKTEYSSLKVANRTSYWVVELLIDLEDLNIVPNHEKTIGFAVIISGDMFNYSWPRDALSKNPSTWGRIYSPDNWATRIDLQLDTIVNTRSIIAGSNLTLTATIINMGDAQIPDYRITVMLDNALLLNATGSSLRLRTPLGKMDSVSYRINITSMVEGTHMIKVNVTGLGVYYDSDEKNNVKTEIFEVRYARIEVATNEIATGSFIAGIMIEFDGRNQTTTEEDEKVVFYSPAGEKTLKVQGIYSPFERLRYVFTRWSINNEVFSENPEIMVKISGDMKLKTEYRKEHLVKISFVDKDNGLLPPLSYACILPNNTGYVGSLNSLWLTSGNLIITMVNYSGVNVLEEAKIYSIYEPEDITIPCRVCDGTLKVLDPLSIPVDGAEVIVIFANGTRIKYVTSSDGIVNIYSIPGGKVTITVNNLGYSMSIEANFLEKREIIAKIPMSLSVVVIILVIMVILVTLIVYKVFLKKGPPPKKTTEYEFEEI